MFNLAFRSVGVACATFGLLLAVSEAAEARQTRIDQRIAGSSVFTADGAIDSVFQATGAPGKGSLRVYTEGGAVGPPSARCQGFDFEIPVVTGTGAATFGDGSQLYAVVTSGYTCGTSAGARRSIIEVDIVGGSGRFAGAIGTATAVIDGVALAPGPGVTASTGTLTGTASTDN